MLRPHLLAVVATLAPVALSPASLAAQERTERGAFVTRLGSDTLAIESYTRSATRLESDLAVRIPRTRLLHYSATLNPDGTVAKLVVTGRPVGDGPDQLPPLDATLTFGADSAHTTLKLGDSTQVFATAVQPGTLPITSYSFALYEQLAIRARRGATDSLAVRVLPLGADQTFETYTVRRGKDAVDIGYFGSPFHARVDRDGRILALDGRETTNKVVVERVAKVDVAQAAHNFAGKDSAGQALGQLSPRDTVRATVGSAHVLVDYSRPHRRGRTIFGGVVPWGQVWRTGANAATGFTTDADLVVNGTTIPKGSYTLFTLPSPTGTKLIVSKETGQWGTEYHPEQDLARLDLASEAVAEPVEIFTIGIDSTHQGGVLIIAWDRTRYSLPFTVR
ncbi:MAG TPA: DUF2911 domain-containing protein [Gemmatimonadales bacterium]|nr:DUF2911 domain-containing protein [Gemmatimonadales bacterium]